MERLQILPLTDAFALALRCKIAQLMLWKSRLCIKSTARTISLFNSAFPLHGNPYKRFAAGVVFVAMFRHALWCTYVYLFTGVCEDRFVFRPDVHNELGGVLMFILTPKEH